MGTERDTVHEGSCLCGKGTFVVDYCNPDHGWPTSTPFWYETSIRCQECNKLYELVEQEKAIVIVEKAEIVNQKELVKQWHLLGNEIMQRPEVNEILRSFITLLRQHGTMAAIHRLLQGANLDYYSLATFRKKWLGPEKWVEGNISQGNLKTVMTLLTIKNDQVSEELARLDELWKAANEPLQSVGTVYTKG
jgi:hypothetical protein